MSDDDLRYGDVVRLVVCADAGATRIVRGEGHVLRNLTAVRPEQRVGDDADYLFQVVPELEHKAAKSESPGVKRGVSSGRFSRMLSRSASLSEEAGFDISKFLKAQEKEELLSNTQRLRALAEDRDAMSTVQYGEIIQLRHVPSGLFLTKVANGLRLVLSEGDSSSCFRVLPRHLHNSEGDTVLIGEQLLLETPHVFGHALSLGAEVDGLEGGHSELIGNLAPEAAEQARAERPAEASESAHGSPEVLSLVLSETTGDDSGVPMKFELHARTLPEERSYLQQGEPVRLWHFDSSSFVTGPSNAAKERCFLRHVMDGDPASSESLSVKAIWSLEPVGKVASGEAGKPFSRGGVLKWEDRFRLRHMPTGKLLGLDESQPDTPPAHGTVTWQRAFDMSHGLHFYTSVATGESQWRMPTNGVIECRDDADRVFYTDAASGKNAWNLEEIVEIHHGRLSGTDQTRPQNYWHARLVSDDALHVITSFGLVPTGTQSLESKNRPLARECTFRLEALLKDGKTKCWLHNLGDPVEKTIEKRKQDELERTGQRFESEQLVFAETQYTEDAFSIRPVDAAQISATRTALACRPIFSKYAIEGKQNALDQPQNMALVDLARMALELCVDLCDGNHVTDHMPLSGEEITISRVDWQDAARATKVIDQLMAMIATPLVHAAEVAQAGLAGGELEIKLPPGKLNELGIWLKDGDAVHVRISAIDDKSPLKGLLLPGDVLVSMKGTGGHRSQDFISGFKGRDAETVTQMLNAASDSERSLIVSDLCNDEGPAPFDGYDGANLPKVRRRRQRLDAPFKQAIEALSTSQSKQMDTHIAALTALTEMIRDSRHSENYVAKMTVPVDVTTGSVIKDEGYKVIIQQAAFFEQAANCTNTLLSNNKALLDQIVTKQTVRNFASLIHEQGPKSLFMDFFKAICSCQRLPIVSNQDLCCDQLLKTTKVEFELKPELAQDGFDGSAVIKTFAAATGGHRVGLLDPSAATRSRLQSANPTCVPFMPNSPLPEGGYMGKTEAEGNGLPMLDISWASLDEWNTGQAALFFSPSKLGILSRRNEPLKGLDGVPLERLVWVLDAKRLLVRVLLPELWERGWRPEPHQQQTAQTNPDEAISNPMFRHVADAVTSKVEQVKSAAVLAADDFATIVGRRSGDDSRPKQEHPSRAECKAELAGLKAGLEVDTWWGNLLCDTNRSKEDAVLTWMENPMIYDDDPDPDTKPFWESAEDFEHQFQLADYYVAQIELFAEMCLGRS